MVDTRPLLKWFVRECKNRGIDQTTIDFEAIVDSTHTYQENKKFLLDEIKKASPTKEIAERDAKIVRLETKLQKIMKTRPSEYIRRLCRTLGLPSLVAQETWKLSTRLGRSNFAQPETIPALVCLASRMHGMPLPLRKVAELAVIDCRTLSRKYWWLLKKFGMCFKPLDARESLSNAGNRLSLPEKVLERARVILEHYEQKRRQGKNPRATAAAAIYMAVMEKGISLTQRRLSEVTGAAVSTIRERYNDILTVKALGAEFLPTPSSPSPPPGDTTRDTSVGSHGKHPPCESADEPILGRRSAP